ncbi:RDD family protein [Corynebacterium ulceribovis]|uniref:RDD family protein n=1 Tax=Corynebacterium ulceribovis TaxID=487732 RepID=UPI000373BD35|nr:RDD family protein [Corynebacterium ulceribovis]
MSQKSSWLDGPQIPGQNTDPNRPDNYPGQTLGLPQRGPGSIVTVLRRVGGLAIDWIISLGIAAVLFPFFGHTPEEMEALGLSPLTTWGSFASSWAIVVFVLVGTVSVWAMGRTPGQAALGMGVARIDEPGVGVGLWRAFLRSILTACLFPPVIQDSDARGLHDRITNTAVIRG